ncbi:MAG: hypothetical protein LBI18_09935, partial [Planctomycetaceae bacterium]|nr:hypothetical protein [Planctomycetaceae bacterium]
QTVWQHKLPSEKQGLIGYRRCDVSANGVLQSANGVLQLANGILQLVHGVLPSANGVLQLANGVLQLANGVLQFPLFGTYQLLFVVNS